MSSKGTLRYIPQKLNFQLGDCDSRNAYRNIASEYSSVFQELPRATVSAIFPTANEEFIYNRECPLDMKTNYRQNYVKHPKATRHNVKIPDLPRLGSDDILTPHRSTYCEAYIPKTTKVPAPCPPDPPENKVLEQGDDFEAKNSQHRAEFRKYSLPEYQKVKASSHYGLGGKLLVNSADAIKPCYSTTTASTYKNPHSLVKLIPIVHHQEIQPSKSAMNLQTTMKADYTEKDFHDSKNMLDVPKSNKRNWQVFEKEPDNKLQPKSTTSNDFQPYERRLHRPTSCKPTCLSLFPPTPFSQLSVYKEDYVKLPSEVWPNETNKRPRNCLKLEYAVERKDHKNIVERTGSHYDDAFHKNNLEGREKATMIMPRLAEVFPLPSTKFPDATSYGVTYKKFTPEEVRKVRNILQKAKYKESTDKFVDDTTFKDHYQWHFIPPRKLIKPIVKEKIDFAFPLEPV